eukprot:707105-Amphidinium_carterae.1
MCPQHWIRPACLLDTDSVVVCCRHTRLTPGPGSWNPIGYYPILEGGPMKGHLKERWQDEDHIVPPRTATCDPEHPEVQRRIPYRIWGDQEASSSSDTESGPGYYEELARLCKVSRFEGNEPWIVDDAETTEHYEELARTRLAMATKQYPFPEGKKEEHEDFVMSHDLTAVDSPTQDVLVGAPSPGGPSAGEGQQPETDLPAMSSTGRYRGTRELSPGGPSAGERQYPDAKRMKIVAKVDEGQDPVRIALTEQEQEELYSYSRRLFAEGQEELSRYCRRLYAEGDDPEKGISREQLWKSDDRCCVCGAPDFWFKPLVDGTCWFKDPRCQHRFCKEHGKTVGHYRPANMNIRWCDCHDKIALPCGLEESERSLPDSDGELPGGGREA